MYLVKKQSLPSGFHIFNASAGSGKTFQLTKSYLILILSNVASQKFREILALTFTNKAVAEMKHRILESLWVFGNPDVSKEDNSLFDDLVTELDLPHKEVEKRCALALKLVLHNYDFFEVSTIDKFTHRVIKTFAKDLKVSQRFEVELDNDILLDEAIGRILQEAQNDTPLQKVLINFSLEKVDADKSWNIILDLKEVGKLLFQENHYAHVQTLKDKNIKDFEDLKTLLKRKIEARSKEIVKSAEEALYLIEENHLEFSDFKGQYFPKFMRQLQTGGQKVDFNASWKQQFDELPLYNKTCPENIKAKLDHLHPKFSKIFGSVKWAVHQLLFFENAYANVLPLTVLNVIAKEISEIQKEREVLHISEFNKLISKEIANQPIPYIYERLGERYRHYFIDEFQDTSKMQWENLIPLIGNALETENLDGERGSLLLVGDAKQSIYRWRGGDPKQFLGLNDESSNPFTVNPIIDSLDTNWRSFDTIIEFNNAFFTHTSEYLKEPNYQNLYKTQCQQKINHRKGGYVEMVFAPKNIEDVALYYCEKVLETVQGIINKGFSFKDICIVVRKNKHGVVLANYLSEHNIPIISSEALLLNNNQEVRFLVSLLRFLDNPSENILQYEVLEYLFRSEKNKHGFITQLLGSLQEFLIADYAYDIKKETDMPVFNILERAIARFDLSQKCGAHVIHLLDVALEIGEKSGVGIFDFLGYWDLKKDSLAISAPQDQDAVQLMTVHKSKGLEFPFVIFPFADSKINDRTKTKKLWVPLSNSMESDFDRILVNASKEIEQYSEASNELYTLENNLSELDDINVLYVALTRAVQGLFIVTRESSGETYGKLFKNYLIHKGIWSSDKSYFEFGHFSENQSKVIAQPAVQSIPYIYTHSDTAPKIVTTTPSLWSMERNESLQWGTLVHEILADVNSIKDVENAIDRASRRGDIMEGDINGVKAILTDILKHPKLSKFYQEKSIGLNETELLDTNGKSYRPDRLVFDDNQIAIIDYKTGSFRQEHGEQLRKYEHLLQKIDPDHVVAQKILVYIGDKIEPVFI